MKIDNPNTVDGDVKLLEARPGKSCESQQPSCQQDLGLAVGF